MLETQTYNTLPQTVMPRTWRVADDNCTTGMLALVQSHNAVPFLLYFRRRSWCDPLTVARYPYPSRPHADRL